MVQNMLYTENKPCAMTKGREDHRELQVDLRLTRRKKFTLSENPSNDEQAGHNPFVVAIGGGVVGAPAVNISRSVKDSL